MKPEAATVPALPENAQGGSVPVEPMSLLSLLILLHKRRKFILGFTASMTVLTTAIVLLIPNKYTATSVVLPPSQNSSPSATLMSQLSGGGALSSLAGAGLGIKSPADMYVSLFRSRTVEDALIHNFSLMTRYHKKTMTDAREAFENRTGVELGPKDGLIRISVTDRDPKFAAQLANAYVDEFRKLFDSLAITEASQRRIFFQQQLLEADADLTKAEDAMKKTEQSTGVLQLDSQARVLIESAAVLRGQISAKEVQLQSMRSYVTEDNPQYIVAEQELDALKGQLAKIAGPDANTGADFAISKSKVPEAGLQYLKSLRDVRYYETIADLIARQFEIAKLDEAHQGVVQVSDIAVPPDKKSSPKRTIIILVVGFFAFILAIFWVVTCESLSYILHLESAAELRLLLRQKR